MKNLFLMLTCLVALLMPQSVWAQSEPTRPSAVVNGTTLTIYTNASGQVSDAVNALSWSNPTKAQITTIVLDGFVNSSDLAAIKGDNGEFTGVTTVDMSEAKFERVVSGESAQNPNRWVKSESYTSLGSGIHAYVGGDLYQYSIHKAWNTTNDRPGNETLYDTYNLMQAAASSSSVGSYAKVPIYKYCQMSYSSGSSWVRIDNGQYQEQVEVNYRDNGSGESYVGDVDHIDSHIGDYNDNQVIFVTVYYKKVAVSGDDPNNVGTWSTTKIYNPTDLGDAQEVFDGNYYNADEDQLENQYGHVGDYTYFRHYYRKTTARSWIDNTPDVTVAPEGVTIVDGGFAYVDRDEYMDYANGTWVKMTTGDYNYYQLVSEDNGSWSSVTNSNDFMDHDIIGHYENSEALPTNNDNNDMKYAIVGGTEKVFNGTSWNDIGSAVTVSDYGEMKFSYWSATLQVAKTSKYADSNISSDIFQNCKSITHIDFLGGHVKGLDNRSAGENNYANFTLYVGKNVTEIELSALNQSTALTGLEFDTDYSAAEIAQQEGGVNVYPKELTIGNMAFNGCFNVFEIVIPNRCVSIGNNAFKNVGNGTDQGNTFTDIDNQELTLVFERRSSQDDGSVTLSCNKPLVIGNSAFQDCWYLKDLTLPIRLHTMGTDCFKNTKSLATLEMREEANANYDGELLRTIPNGAFHGSAVANVTIPKCVTKIESGAFGETKKLEKLVIQDTEEKENNKKLPLHIESGAFTGGTEAERPQFDVYVNINPLDATNPGRMVICEYESFNFTQTVGQTSTGNEHPSFAVLHFPEDAWDYYQGNWKRGLAFQQGNLNAFKDGYHYDYEDPSIPDCDGKYNGAKSDIDTTTGKYETGNNGTQYTPANGWQEFARTSTAIDIIIDKKGLLRTYSTLKPQVIPVDASSNKPLFKTYRITNFTYSASGSAATATEVEAKLTGETTRAYIPANTGLIMVGDQLPADYIFYMSDIDTQNTEYEYPFDNDFSNDNPRVNLLYPTCNLTQYDGPDPSTFPGASTVPGGIHVPTVNATEGNVVLYATIPNPYNTRQTRAEKGGLQYHLFGLSSSAAGQFNRIKNGTKMTRDKAYLKLTPTQFPVDNEGANATGSGVTPPANANAPIMLSFFNSEGELTDVRTIDLDTLQEVNTNIYYTLQGVKLNARPTQQGIYIHNGKKIVIK